MSRKLLLLCLVAFVAPMAVAANFTPIGIWARHDKWQSPPPEAELPQEKYASGLLLNFCKGGEFRMASGTFYWTPGNMSLGVSDGIAVFSGEWVERGDHIEIEYKLDSAEIVPVDRDGKINPDVYKMKKMTATRKGDDLDLSFRLAFNDAPVRQTVQPEKKQPGKVDDEFVKCKLHR